MTKHDAFGTGRHIINETHELSAVTMPGEPIAGLYIHFNRETNEITSDIHRDFLCASLNPPANGSFSLISDEHQRIFAFPGPVFKVLHDRATVHHTTGGKHDTRVLLTKDFFSHLTAINAFENLR